MIPASYNDDTLPVSGRDDGPARPCTRTSARTRTQTPAQWHNRLARLLILALLITTPSGCAPVLLPMAAVSGTAMAGGMLYRQRGGALDLGIGTQGARLVWAVPTGLLVAGLAGAWWLAPLVAGTTFAGQLFGHAAHQRSGAGLDDEPADYRQTTPLTDWLETVFGPYDRAWPSWRKELWHYAGSSEIELIRATLIVAPALAFDPGLGWAILTGLFPAYEIGWRLPSDQPYLKQGTEVAEFLVGASLFLVLTLAAGLP